MQVSPLPWTREATGSLALVSAEACLPSVHDVSVLVNFVDAPIEGTGSPAPPPSETPPQGSEISTF